MGLEEHEGSKKGVHICSLGGPAQLAAGVCQPHADPACGGRGAGGCDAGGRNGIPQHGNPDAAADWHCGDARVPDALPVWAHLFCGLLYAKADGEPAQALV